MGNTRIDGSRKHAPDPELHTPTPAKTPTKAAAPAPKPSTGGSCNGTDWHPPMQGSCGGVPYAELGRNMLKAQWVGKSTAELEGAYAERETRLRRAGDAPYTGKEQDAAELGVIGEILGDRIRDENAKKEAAKGPTAPGCDSMHPDLCASEGADGDGVTAGSVTFMGDKSGPVRFGFADGKAYANRKDGVGWEAEGGIVRLQGSKRAGDMTVRATVDAATVSVGQGTHNADGSSGMHIGAQATVVGAQLDVGYSTPGSAADGASATLGFSGGVGAAGSLGVKTTASSTLACGSVSAAFLTLGACIPVPVRP